MATSRLPWSILRRLDRTLVYSTLDQLLTRSVRVASEETLLGDVFRGVSMVVPMPPATTYQEGASDLGALLKYGFLDLTFGLTRAPFELKPARLGTLRSLGFVDGYSGEQSPDWEHDLLDELARDAEAGDLYLKVFLESPHIVKDRESVSELMRRLNDGLPSDFWPHSFVVRDACVTNAESAWLAKHVYL